MLDRPTPEEQIRNLTAELSRHVAALQDADRHHTQLHTRLNALENDLRSQTRAVRELEAELADERATHKATLGLLLRAEERETGLRAELGAAQETIATIRDAGERIDRAMVAYETRQKQEQAATMLRRVDFDTSPEPDGNPEDLRSPLAAERDKLVETIGRLVSLPPEQIAEMHKVGYSGLGSPEARAQDEEGA